MKGDIRHNFSSPLLAISLTTSLWKELKKITFSTFTFHLRATTKLHLPPYKGSTLRGAFGITFKDIVCAVSHKDCNICIIRLTCPYSYIFDTPVPDDSKRMRKYQRIPHPFIVEPPLDKEVIFESGSSLTFGLTLIGKTIDYLPYFIYTFDCIGKEKGIGKGRGKFEIARVTWIDSAGDEKLVYDGDKKVLISSQHPLTINDFSIFQNSGPIILSYLTPVRITYNNHLYSGIEFHVVIRNLLRRLSNLAYFHCGRELNVDFKQLIEKSKQIKTKSADIRWYDWERYSVRQDTKMKMGGVVGKIEYEGNLTEFLPLLKLGEIVHIGKGTAFGLGRYKLLFSIHIK